MGYGDNNSLTDPSFSILTKLSNRNDSSHVVPEPGNILLNGMKRSAQINEYAKLGIQELLNVISADFHENMKETFATVSLQLTTAHNLEAREEELEYTSLLIKEMNEKFIQYTEKEEQLLFPLISAANKKQKVLRDVNEMSDFISGLKSAHEWFREKIRLLKKITNGYLCDASCTPSHKLAYAHLNDLEQDFNRLFFIEEEYLFPNALRMTTKTSRS